MDTLKLKIQFYHIFHELLSEILFQSQELCFHANHLKNHKEIEERHVNHLTEHINWQKIKAKKVLELALKNNMISIDNEIVSLTKKGIMFTTTAIDFITDNKGEAIEQMKENFFLFRG